LSGIAILGDFKDLSNSVSPPLEAEVYQRG
jgi:hypothetical protein